MKTRMNDVAAAVDASYPDNADLTIDEQGRPSLKARKSAGNSAEALKLATAVKDRLPERSLLDPDHPAPALVAPFRAVALFSRFVPCGVWEAVYIIEGVTGRRRRCRHRRPRPRGAGALDGARRPALGCRAP